MRRALLGVGLVLLGLGVPAAPAIAAAPPLLGTVVALDPGHQIGNTSHPAEIARPVFIGNAYKPCNTTGTATDAGYPESRFTMQVADALRADLQALGATVLMTRYSEDPSAYGPCVDDRGRFGASVHADLMVSLHGDGAAADLHGFHVIRPGLVPGFTDDIVAPSLALSDAVREGLHRAGFAYADYYGGTGAVERTDLGTLNMSDVPVVMTELGNMRNAGDAATMTSPAGQAALAGGLAAGIEQYLLASQPCAPSSWVQGLILRRYRALGGPCGLLGAPLTRELATPVRYGRYNVFQGGSIYWSPPTGAWEVHGLIRDRWAALGWEGGPLGFPTSNEHAAPAGRRSDFEHGWITWSPARGTRVHLR